MRENADVGENSAAREQTLNDYLTLLKRRWWIVVIVAVVATVVAYQVSSSEPKLYSATSTVLIAGAATGVSSPFGSTQAEIDIASSTQVAQRAVRALRLTSRSARMVQSELTVRVPSNSSSAGNLLTLSVSDRDPTIARALANVTAQQFIAYSTALNTAFLTTTRREILARMTALQLSHSQHSSAYKALSEKNQGLLADQALQTVSGVVLRPATAARQVQPDPKNDAIMAFVIGLVLGFGLALLWDRFDTQVRSAQEASSVLGQELVGRLSPPPRRFREGHGLVMLDDPGSSQAEEFRQLRTSLEFANAETQASVIMVTSAQQGEGKSTTTANLAVALAKAGKNVAVVDIDLREPTLHKLFDLQNETWPHGLTTVALGRVSLDEAIVHYPVQDALRPQARSNGNGSSPVMYLHVLPCGPAHREPGDLVGSKAVWDVLTQLRQRVEIVLLDAPPLLGVSDALSLSSIVDGVLMVSMLGVSRRPQLSEALRILRSSPASKLGVIVTRADQDERYRGYRSAAYYYRPVRTVPGVPRAPRREASHRA